MSLALVIYENGVPLVGDVGNHAPVEFGDCEITLLHVLIVQSRLLTRLLGAFMPMEPPLLAARRHPLLCPTVYVPLHVGLALMSAGK